MKKRTLFFRIGAIVILLAIAAGTQSCTARHSARSTASGDLFLMFCFISFLSFCRNRAKTPTL